MPSRQERSEFWQNDKDLGWSQIPNTNSQFLHPEFKVKVRVNSEGLRDDEFTIKRKSKKRILILGDSFAWGFGVEEKDRFSELLENKLDNYAIINAGVSGYSTIQQLLYLKEKGIKYNPDIVLLLFFQNDYYENSASNVYWHNKPYAVIENDSLIINNMPVPEQNLYQKFRAYMKANFYSVTFF